MCGNKEDRQRHPRGCCSDCEASTRNDGKSLEMHSGSAISMEDMQEICDRLLVTLKATRYYKNLRALAYVRTKAGSEIVIAEWGRGRQQEINVTMDSGVAMVRDIVRELE